MARTSAGFNCLSITDLTSQLNTALAALVNPTIRGLVIKPIRLQRKSSFELNAVLTYDTGGAGLGTPFIIGCFQETNLPALITDLNTYYGVISTSFIAAPLFIDVEDDQSKLAAYIAVVLSNTTSGASANFLPLVGGF